MGSSYAAMQHVIGLSIFCLVLFQFFQTAITQCSEDDTVDVGGGPGSCLDNCDCPSCAPHCSKWGYCQATALGGSHPARCDSYDTGSCPPPYSCYKPLLQVWKKSKKSCPCGGGGRCGRKCCKCFQTK